MSGLLSSPKRPRLARSVIVLALVLGTTLVAGQAAAADRAFVSPTGNLGCQITDRVDYAPNQVFCQSFNRPQVVRMGLNGRLRICRAERCLGNPAEDTPTLGYGRAITVGRFRCTMKTDGIRCRVRATGKGFLINRDTIRRIS